MTKVDDAWLSKLPRSVTVAVAASAAGDSESAIREFGEAALDLPVSAIPHLLLGAELAQVGRMDEAQTAYARAILVAPDLAVARYQLGLSQLCVGKVPQAIVTWQPLLATDSDESLRHMVQGFMYLIADAFDQAVAEFELGIAANTTNPALNADIQQVIDRAQHLNVFTESKAQGRHRFDDSDAGQQLANYQVNEVLGQQR